MRQSNGDTNRAWPQSDKSNVVGVGSFHKSLPHNDYGEVIPTAFTMLVDATQGKAAFAQAPQGQARPACNGTVAQLTNPQAGLAADRLTHSPTAYAMLPAPSVTSETTAAEMTELYWMALLRDVSLDALSSDPGANTAVGELNQRFSNAIADTQDAGHIRPGLDLPGTSAAFAPFTADTLFRLGLPGEELGPMISQFFLRPIAYGVQTIDQRLRPYAKACDFLTEFDDWLAAQNSGTDRNCRAYSRCNEENASFFEGETLRYIATMRDLARFVNKDALHQAYFNAALILLSGKADWTPGNPYATKQPLAPREAGFGVLGGPHILALVSEVATRALKIAWNQKWQVHLRLRPEAYGGLVHVENVGVAGNKRAYGLPQWIAKTSAAKELMANNQSYLLPMAFTAGSPTHPSYGAGHATVAGACVTILKAYFDMGPIDKPLLFKTLKERSTPYDPPNPIKAYDPKVAAPDGRADLAPGVADTLTIEGELNKLAQNVAMGRSMGGVHWRTDNTRSLILGEALAAEILAEISTDSAEKPIFTFRTFARRADGLPRTVVIDGGRITVDGAPMVTALE